MLRLICGEIVLIASVWLGVAVTRHPGYVLFVFQPWMMQMPIWFALLSLVILLVLFYLLINSIDQMQFLWYRFKNWLRFRRAHQAYSKTQSGVAALIEGGHKQAEKQLLAGVSDATEPLINYLGAAVAAHEQAAYERRDGYIQKAYQAAPEEVLAIGLTQATLEFRQGQNEHAIATLNHLRQKYARHPGVLQLLKTIYLKLQDWQGLLFILSDLRKAGVCSGEHYLQLERQVYSGLLMAMPPKTYDELQALWQSMPKAMRYDPAVTVVYVKQLSRFPNTAQEIEGLIKTTLKNHWEPTLVSLYGGLPFSDLNRQLVIAGGWLKRYGSRPELLLLLGRLCERLKLWGKAKDYFERCLALGPNAETALAYGKLLEALDEREAALQIYRDVLGSLQNKE